MEDRLKNGNSSKLRLAIVGGGERCLALFDMLELELFQGLGVETAAVIDPDPGGACLAKARDKGVPAGTDPSRLWETADLDLIVELSGDRTLTDRLAAEKPASVSLTAGSGARLLHDVIRLVGRLQETKDQADLAQSLTRLLIGASSEGMLLLDPDYRIIRANEAALKSAGLSAEDAAGRFCYQVSHQNLSPCHSTDAPCPMRSTLATGVSAHAIHEHLQQDGSSVYCDVSTYPLLDQNGRVVKVLEVFRDITDDLAQRMETRTRALRHDLARMVREDRLISLGKLVASVAHEINNPIGSILNFSKLMKRGLAEGKIDQDQLNLYQDWLNLTVLEAERVEHTVKNLLSFARQGNVSRRPVDLAQIVRTTIDLAAHHLALAGIEATVDIPPGKLVVHSDPHQLQQVVTNLMLNAKEAMDRGGRLVIRGRVSDDGRQAVLEIEDNGAGIAEENLDNIFEPFFSTKDASNGTGLGLSVVYGIVRRHRGEVEVESEPGRGTCFRLRFPIHDHESEETEIA